MGRTLQKKKNRSSTPKVPHKPKSKKRPILGNAIVAANWNPSLTLSQNYHRLGLTRKLNAPTGGTEYKPTSPSSSLASKQNTTTTKTDTLHNISTKAPKQLIPTLAHVERDATSGAILRVLSPPPSTSQNQPNPLNDLLLLNDDIPPLQTTTTETHPAAPPSTTNVVQKLEHLAKLEKTKTPRNQSAREQEWLRALVDKYNEDFRAMSRDVVLNPMQQSEGDIRRRVERWRRI